MKKSTDSHGDIQPDAAPQQDGDRDGEEKGGGGRVCSILVTLGLRVVILVLGCIQTLREHSRRIQESNKKSEKMKKLAAAHSAFAI